MEAANPASQTAISVRTRTPALPASQITGFKPQPPETNVLIVQRTASPAVDL